MARSWAKVFSAGVVGAGAALVLMAVVIVAGFSEVTIARVGGEFFLRDAK
jgi:hypothetical protein